MGIVLLAIINFAILSIITRIGQKLIMKITGASVMFFDGKKRIITIITISIICAVAFGI